MAVEKDFSELYKKINQQRALRKESTRKKLAQAAGGTAATLRGESAPEAFARRAPDYSKQMMTPEEKMLKRMELLKYQEDLDQFYYGKQQQKYLRELEQEMQNRRAMLRAETALMQESGQAARARATAKRLEIGSNIDEDVARGKSIITPSQRLKDNLRNVVPLKNVKGINERKQAFTKEYNGLSKANKTKFKQKNGLNTEADVDAWMSKRAADTYEREKNFAVNSAVNTAESLMKDGDRDDIANGIPMLATMAGTTTETLLEALGGNASRVYTDLSNNQIQEQQALLDNIERKQIERAQASARTYGSTGGVGRAQKDLMARPQTRMMAPQAMAPQAMEPDAGLPQEVQDPGAAPQQQQKPGFMGIPGARVPETSQQRALEMMNIIEQFPEHEPAKQAKMEIMASKELEEYGKRFGPDAPKELVFREAARDARLKQKESIKKFKEKKREKRLAETKARFAKVKKPSVPVTGSDKGIGDTSDVPV